MSLINRPQKTEPMIRPVEEADLAACAEIYVDAFAQAPYFEEWTPQASGELLAALYRKDPRTCFCMVFHGEVAGFAFCSTIGRFRAVIEEFALHPDFHHRGWGKLLMNHCISYFTEQGYSRVELIANSSAPAFGFYRKLGFRASHRYVLMLKDI